MATVKAESFEETFKKLVALFDSGNAGEAENAFRKAVLLCAKHGLRFCDAIAHAFGQDDGRTAELEAQNAALQERLDKREADGGKLADLLDEAEEEITALKNGQTQKRGEREAGFKGWFRHAWSFAQFRLLALTVIIAAAMVLDAALRPMISGLPDAQDVVVWQRIWGGFVWAAVLSLFVASSVALCRRYGFTQMLMKWVVYCSVVAVGCMALPPCPALLVVLLVAMVLTLSRLNEWLSEQVRMKVWESNPVQAVRGWF